MHDPFVQQLFSIPEYPDGSSQRGRYSITIFWAKYCCDGFEKKKDRGRIKRQGEENDPCIGSGIDIFLFGGLKKT